MSIKASTSHPIGAAVTRMDYLHPKGGTVASVVLEGIDAPTDTPHWVLVIPERCVDAMAITMRGERWATKAETEQDARTCLERVAGAILAWNDRRMDSDKRLVDAIDQATSVVGVRQEALPLSDGEQR